MTTTTAAARFPPTRTRSADAAQTIALDGPIDWKGFVHAARALVEAGAAPTRVRWTDGTQPQSGGLFDEARYVPALELPTARALSLPASFVERAKTALLHADPLRFDLIYRMVWRLSQDRNLVHDLLDPDRLRLDTLVKAVRREEHKMHAFVRFRKVAAGPVDGAADAASGGSGGDRTAAASSGGTGAGTGRAQVARESVVRHVAWFEPDHHVLEAVAAFFVRRFAAIEWAILTPRVCVAWDRRKLTFGPGANKADAPAADADEALWLAYYGSIFNPARVKEAAMKKEMPRRYWKNLPEAQLIAPLLADAPARVQRMVAASGTERARRRGVAVAEQSTSGGEAQLQAAAAALLATDPHQPPDRATIQLLRAEPESLTRLAERASGCRACPIGAGATQMVWGEGAARARLMLVGEQPGDREDLAGRPFVGPAGTLLKRALTDLDWPAERLYMTNAVKHFKYELRGKRRIHKTASQREVGRVRRLARSRDRGRAARCIDRARRHRRPQPARPRGADWRQRRRMAERPRRRPPGADRAAPGRVAADGGWRCGKHLSALGRAAAARGCACRASRCGCRRERGCGYERGSGAWASDLTTSRAPSRKPGIARSGEHGTRRPLKIHCDQPDKASTQKTRRRSVPREKGWARCCVSVSAHRAIRRRPTGEASVARLQFGRSFQPARFFS